ncbi:MAG: ribbon-helix-helix domain-containing protein [Bacillota bacterium]
MVRTQIQITEEQAAALKERSALLGVSMAELIRRGIDQVLVPNGGSVQQERVRRAIQAAGRFRSGLHDVSANHDKYLAEVYQK